MLAYFVQLLNSLLPSTLRSSHAVLVVEKDSVTDPTGNVGDVTIDVLPDDALLEIFSFYVNAQTSESDWYTLVHVCRRWRYVVFASQRRLNLQVLYGGSRPLSTTPDSWPVLPLAVSRQYDVRFISPLDKHECHLLWSSNIAAALESGNLISEIHLHNIPDSHLETIAAAMQKPFPELTSLIISTKSAPVVVFPHPFLGGSAPRLRSLQLRNCSFPGIQKLLLSASDLVTLHLCDIPDSGYISPQAMVTALSMMTRLEYLLLDSCSPRFLPDPASRPQPPLVRLVLPALTKLEFQGVHEYLEDLVAQIDAPLLGNFKVTFFMDLNFEVRQLPRFISHAEKFKKLGYATIFPSKKWIAFFISVPGDYGDSSHLSIKCKRLDLQLSSLAQVFTSFSPLLSVLERLEIQEGVPHWQDLRPRWEDDIGSTQWRRLLDPFTAVKSLYISDGAVFCVCDALNEFPAVLPALQSLTLWRPPPGDARKTVGTFVATRHRSGHPVSVYSQGSRYWKDITQKFHTTSGLTSR